MLMRLRPSRWCGATSTPASHHRYLTHSVWCNPPETPLVPRVTRLANVQVTVRTRRSYFI